MKLEKLPICSFLEFLKMPPKASRERVQKEIPLELPLVHPRGKCCHNTSKITGGVKRD